MRSLRKAAKIDPKKQPAVSNDTTLEEIWAFRAEAKPPESVGSPKSSLKLFKERTLPMTPVSYPVWQLQLAVGYQHNQH